MFFTRCCSKRLQKHFATKDPKSKVSLMILPTQYTTLVKPAFEEFCLPTKKYADVIVPRGAENTVAIDLISQHMQVKKN